MNLKRITAGLIALSLVCSASPFSVYDNTISISHAEDSAGKAAAEFNCGKYVKLTLENGVARVSLKDASAEIKGAVWIYNYDEEKAPWDSVKEDIETLIIDEGVTDIGANAFEGCENLKNLVLPSTLKSIRFCTFQYCYALKSVTIPSSVEQIADGAFLNTGIEKLIYAGSEEQWDAVDKGAQFIGPQQPEIQFDVNAGSAGTTVQWSFDNGSGTLKINGSGSIADYAEGEAPWAELADTVKSVEIDKNIDRIGDNAFSGLKNLSSVAMSGVTSIGKNAFIGCDSLEEVVLPDNISEISKDAFSGDALTVYCKPGTKAETAVKASGIKYQAVSGSCGPSMAYSYNKDSNEINVFGAGKMDDFSKLEDRPWNDVLASVKKITISDGVTSVGNNALNGASAVTEIILGDTIETIGSDAFSGISSVESLFLPDELTEIGSSAFSGCTSLETCVIGNKLKTIGSAAFFVEVPEKDMTILFKGDEAAWNKVDKTINNGYLDDAVMVYNVDGGKYSDNIFWVYSLDEKQLIIQGSGEIPSSDSYPWSKYADTAESVIFSVIFTDKIENIGNKAFAGFTALKSVTMNDAVVSIDDEAFSGCTALEKVIFSPAIKTIGDNAFSKCAKLKTADFPDTLETIGSHAFDNCDSLSYVKIPLAVKSIGDHAFFECDKLKEVYFEPTDTVINEKAFGYSSESRVNSDLAIITFDGTTAKEYADTNGIRAISTKSGNSCGENIVYSFDEATGVLTVFGHGATFDYDNGKNKAPWNSEGYASEIKEVVFSDDITRIGNSFLQNARSLEKVTLPSSLESIGSQAFRDNKVVESFRLPSTLKTIGRNAFMGAQSLAKLFFEGDAPEILGDANGNNRTFMDAYGTEIYAHLSRKGWDTFRENSGIKDDITFIDLDKTSLSDKLTIVNIPESVIVGEAYPLEVDIDPLIASEFVWVSSSPEVIQVSNKGVLTAFGEGEAKITVQSKYDESISYSFIISSSDKNKLHSADKADTLTLDGKNYFNNASANNYNEYTTFCTKYVNSFLTQNQDGSFLRIENVKNDTIYIESYDKDMKLQSTKTIDSELAHFLGYYHGQDGYHYFLFGQNNMEKDDELEVYRLVRYDSDFTNRVAVKVDNMGESSVSHLDFSNGVARMSESDKYLYITTAHTVYQGHQENIILVFNKETLERIYNASFYTRSSHSFNGFIDYDGEYIYLADHGDYNPRAMLVQRFPKNTFSMTNNRKMNVFDITVPDHPVWGDNYTGATIGGFAVSDSTTLLAGTSIDQTLKEVDENTQSNIFLTVTDNTLTHAETEWLTSYPEGSGIQVRTPQMVKLNNNQFLIMWEEYDTKKKNTTTSMVITDQNGVLLTQPEKTELRLSDCQPFVASDGTVMWYVTDNTKPIVYKVNPYSFEKEDTNSITYTYDKESGTLHVSGKGNIPNYTDLNDRDWIKESGADPEKVKTIIVDGSIYKIGDRVFEDLPALENVFFNSDTYTIGEKAFSDCENLRNVVLPDKLTNLGFGSFNNDDSIEKIVVPETLTKADFGWMYATDGVDVYYTGTQEQWDEVTSDLYDTTKKLKDIKVGSDAGSSGEKSYWVYDPKEKTLEVFGEDTIDKQDEGKYPWSEHSGDTKNIIVSGDFDKVPDNAFVDFKEAEHVKITGDVASVGKNSFAGTDKTNYIITKPSLKDIEDKSIGFDSDLEKKEDFTIIGTKSSASEKYAKDNGIDFVAVDGYCGDDLAYSFDKDTGKLTIYGSGDMYDFEDKKQPWNEVSDSIKSVEFPEEITRIGNNAFNSHNKLNNVVIPESVKEIGTNAFYNSSSLDTITIRSTDYTLDETSFFNGYGIDRTINFTGTKEQWEAVSTESENEASDKVVFNYVEPPTPVTTETTSVSMTSAANNTVTTANVPNSTGTSDNAGTMPGSGTVTTVNSPKSTDVSDNTGTTPVSDTGTSAVGTTSNSGSVKTENVQTTASVQNASSGTNGVPSVNTTSNGGSTANNGTNSNGSVTTNKSSDTTAAGSEGTQTTVYVIVTGNGSSGNGGTTPPTTTAAAPNTPENKLMLGDVNADGKVDASDASEVLKAYSIYSTGGVPDYLSSEQLRVADIDGDGAINAGDASQILVYYSYLSTGGKDSFEDFLKK